MAEMVQITVRLEKSVKQEAERICSEIGISMSSAIIIYLKKVAREKRIPFELTAEPISEG